MRTSTKLLSAVAVALASLTVAAPATASDAKTEVVPYRTSAAFEKGILSTGRLESRKDSCISGRPYRSISSKGKKSKVVETGRSSRDGAIATGALNREFGNGHKLSYVVPATKGCKAARARVPKVEEMEDPLRRDDIATSMFLVGIDGKGKAGAFGGLIGTISSKRSCFADRKVTLTGSGSGVLDKGTTTSRGVWSLSVTKQEFDSIMTFTGKVAASKDGADNCSASSFTFPDDGPDM